MAFLNRAALSKFILMTAGALVGAFAVIVFLAPFDIAPSGISGIAVIMHNLFGTPIGLVILIGNIPIQVAAYRLLGGIRVVAWTVYVVLLYSIAIDVLQIRVDAINDDLLLNALFGGIIGGIGSGLIYRAGGTFGGTSTLARIFQEKLGLPLSNTYLYTNILTVVLAGLVFGWAGALYAVVTLAVEGAVSDYLLEGPSVIRTGVVITDHPREVADAILYGLGRGVTSWTATGMFTGQTRHILYVTVARFQINALREVVAAADPGAFLVIGQGHVAYGHGFRSITPPEPAQRNDG